MFCQQFVLAEWRALFLSADPISSGSLRFCGWCPSAFSFSFSILSIAHITSMNNFTIQSSFSWCLFRVFSFISFFTVIKLLFRIPGWLSSVHFIVFSLYFLKHILVSEKSPNCPLAEVVSWTVLKRAEWLAFWLSLTWVAKATAGSAWGHFACRSDSAGRASVFSLLGEGADSECCFSP